MSLEELGTLGEERGEMGAVALLLALDDEADTAWELTGGVTQGLDGLNAVEQLTASRVRR